MTLDGVPLVKGVTPLLTGDIANGVITGAEDDGVAQAGSFTADLNNLSSPLPVVSPISANVGSVDFALNRVNKWGVTKAGGLKAFSVAQSANFHDVALDPPPSAAAAAHRMANAMASFDAGATAAASVPLVQGRAPGHADASAWSLRAYRAPCGSAKTGLRRRFRTI